MIVLMTAAQLDRRFGECGDDVCGVGSYVSFFCWFWSFFLRANLSFKLSFVVQIAILWVSGFLLSSVTVMRICRALNAGNTARGCYRNPRQ